jgi:hypothetical protein
MKDVFLARLYRTRRYFIGSAFIAIAVIGFSLVLPSQKTNAVAVRGNTHTNEYMQANWNAQIARGIPYPVRTEPMVLRGSWDEMGRQYGKSSGKYIRIVYDAFYGLWLNSRLDPNKLGAVLDRYQGEAKTLSPEMVEFAQGISEGAAIELDDADHAPALTNMQKIMLINCPFEVVFPTAWPHVAEMMGMSQPSQTNVAQWEPFASHTWAAWGNMTPGGGTIMGGTRDQPWFPTLYNVSYVAIPSDKKAAVTWGNAIAGLVASSAQVNEHGVGLGNTTVSERTQYFGVPHIFTTAYISFFAHNAKEAVDIFTKGTPDYRQATSRSTLAATTGFFQAFADSREGFVVERTGRNYAVRTTGDQHEPGDYVVLANHAVAPDSNDEFGDPMGQPMEDWTTPSGPDSSTRSRYWALFYEFDKYRGKVTPKFAEKTIAPLKHTYTPDGQLVTERDGIPVWRLGLTPERWLIPNPADPNSLPTGGNNMYFVTDLKNRDIYWIQGIPSHWSGKWDHVSLSDPAWECLRNHQDKSCKAQIEQLHVR